MRKHGAKRSGVDFTQIRNGKYRRGAVERGKKFQHGSPAVRLDPHIDKALRNGISYAQIIKPVYIYSV